MMAVSGIIVTDGFPFREPGGRCRDKRDDRRLMTCVSFPAGDAMGRSQPLVGAIFICAARQIRRAIKTRGALVYTRKACRRFLAKRDRGTHYRQRREAVQHDTGQGRRFRRSQKAPAQLRAVSYTHLTLPTTPYV